MIADSVNILGTTWKIMQCKKKEDAYLAGLGGYTDVTTKTIVIRKRRETPKVKDCKDLRELERGSLRHEIVHAFMQESGLWYNSARWTGAWAMNEEMVDWIAQQHEKIHAAFVEAGAINPDTI